MLVVLTRPDDTPVAINAGEVVHVAPVPVSGPLMGPLTKGTRIVFRNQTHQDVKQLFDEVVGKIDPPAGGAARALAAAPRKAAAKGAARASR